jgi:hypothetical protein
VKELRGDSNPPGTPTSNCHLLPRGGYGPRAEFTGFQKFALPEFHSSFGSDARQDIRDCTKALGGAARTTPEGFHLLIPNNPTPI